MNDNPENREIEPANPGETNPENAAVKVIPSIKETFMVGMFTVFFVFFLSSMFVVFSDNITVGVEFFLIELLIIVPAIFYIKVSGYSIKRVFRFNAVDGRMLLISVVIGFSLIFTVNFVEMLTNMLPLPDWYTDMKNEVADGILNALIINSFFDFIILTLSVVILAGLSEEMLFRGLLQNTFENRLSPSFAIVLTSFIFAMLHPSNLIPIMVLAVVLGIMTWKSNSIFPAMVIHMMNNGISLYALNTMEDIQIDPNMGIDISLNMFILSMIVLAVSLKYFFNLNNAKEKKYDLAESL